MDRSSLLRLPWLPRGSVMKLPDGPNDGQLLLYDTVSGPLRTLKGALFSMPGQLSVKWTAGAAELGDAGRSP